MSARRLVALTVLLATALAATAQTPASTGYVPLSESECYACHGPGNWTPDMDPIVAFAAAPVVLVRGETVGLRMEVFNAWVVPSGDFELSGFVGRLDLTDAPSLRAVSGIDDVHVGPIEGWIPFDLAAPATSLHPEQYVPLLTEDQRGHVSIQVPEGATDVLLTAKPDSTDLGAADLSIAIYPGREEPAGFPAFEVDDAGAGEAEVLHIDDPALLSEHGYGTWTVDAAARAIDTDDGTVTTVDDGIGFTVELHAWFNATEDALTLSDTTIGSGESTELVWTVAVLEAPTGLGQLRGVLEVSGHYEHTGPEPDDQDFSIPFEVPLSSTDGEVMWGTLDGGVVLEHPPVVSMAVLSEIIGYIAGILILASMWTGGIFGRGSRRRQNRIFGTAKRRVAFHNFLSYGILLFAVIHLVLFLLEINYHWALGLIWGGLGILAMLGLGVTGALQIPMIRAWGHGAWRWTHFGLAIATLLFTIVHILLDGTHFGDLQDTLGWVDPLVPESRQ